MKYQSLISERSNKKLAPDCHPLNLPRECIALGKSFFQPKVSIFFLFLDKNICCGYSLKALLMSTHNIRFHQEIRKLFS